MAYETPSIKVNTPFGEMEIHCVDAHRGTGQGEIVYRGVTFSVHMGNIAPAPALESGWTYSLQLYSSRAAATPSLNRKVWAMLKDSVVPHLPSIINEKNGYYARYVELMRQAERDRAAADRSEKLANEWLEKYNAL
jgi:hypothetical protein